MPACVESLPLPQCRESVLTSHTDVKELIPEFYDLEVLIGFTAPYAYVQLGGAFLRNSMDLQFGVKVPVCCARIYSFAHRPTTKMSAAHC